MNKKIMIATAALLGLPTVLAAQARVEAQTSATVRAETRTEAKSGGAEARGNGAVAIEAAARGGLPQAPVRRVIAEGEARGASAAQIDRAALEVVARLRASREALSGGEESRTPSEAEITAGAEALLSGASRVDLQTVRDAAPAERSLTASLTALAAINARGAESGNAAAAVAAQLARGASDQAIGSLATGVNAAAGLGASVGATVGAAVNGAVGGAAGGATGGAGAAADAAAGVTGTVGAAGGAVNVGAGVVGTVTGGIR